MCASVRPSFAGAVFRVLDPERVQVLAQYAARVVGAELEFPSGPSGERTYGGPHRYLARACDMPGAAAVVFERVGSGGALLLGPHPELHPTQPGSALPEGAARFVLPDLIRWARGQ